MGSVSGIREILGLEAALARALPTGPLPAVPTAELLRAARAWSEAVWDAAVTAGPLQLSNDEVRRGLDLGTRPVVLCGAHRSGTTLLQNLLDGHPALLVLPSEGSFLQTAERAYGSEWIRRLANPVNQPPFFLLGRSTAELSPYVEFARAFQSWFPKTRWPLLAVALAYASWRSAQLPPTPQRWVEKTPGRERNLAQLWRVIPSAKAIHIVRNPGAVFASRIRLDPAAWSSWRHRARVLRELDATYRIAGQFERETTRYHLVTYEELIADPARVMAGVANFLEIEWSNTLAQPTVAGLRALPNTSFMDRSEAVLTSEQRALLDACVGRSAERLGYERGSSRDGGFVRRLAHGIW